MDDLEQKPPSDPFSLFRTWFQAGMESGLVDPNAMTLATAGRDGRPSARMVLLKEFDERGFVFYTNYESRKARELQENPRAALILYWAPLHRSIRVEGTVERVSAEMSDAYWSSRPRGSQIAARASEQSRTVGDRERLLTAVSTLEGQFAGEDVPRPASWGGYRVVPEVIEFWQGRRDRLHDRLVYRRTATGWETERLYP